MKKHFLIILSLALFYTTAAQELMTIGEVFDFEIGDEFQTRSSVSYQPPNADRVTITGKYYSAGQDTVFYIQHHDMYYSVLSYEGGPHLEYHYGTLTNTVFYTDLDSSIAVFDYGFTIDQYIESSAELCDSLINGCGYSSGPGFENDFINNEYGKGLGRTYQYFYSGMGGYATIENTLFYYKKGILTCGEPDMTGVGIEEIPAESSLSAIYPNPATESFNIPNSLNLSGEITVSIMNIRGEMVGQETFSGQNLIRMDVSKLIRGIYLVKIQTPEGIDRRKLLIQ